MMMMMMMMMMTIRVINRHTNTVMFEDTYNSVILTNFWAGLKEEFLHISSLAVRTLLPFASTYLCGSGFSRYASTKTKYCSRLNAEHAMRIQLSNTVPDFKALLDSRPIHPSHYVTTITWT
jgi:hypothetical protein